MRLDRHLHQINVIAPDIQAVGYENLLIRLCVHPAKLTWPADFQCATRFIDQFIVHIDKRLLEATTKSLNIVHETFDERLTLTDCVVIGLCRKTRGQE